MLWNSEGKGIICCSIMPLSDMSWFKGLFKYVLVRYLSVHVIGLPQMLLSHILIFEYLLCKVAYEATGVGWCRVSEARFGYINKGC